MISFHEKLKGHIQSSPYDYKSLSLEIGQGERYISNMLSGKSDPGFSNVVKMCAALKISPNQMAGLNEEIYMVNNDDRINSEPKICKDLNSAIKSISQNRKTGEDGIPLVDDILIWWHEKKGMLDDVGWLNDHVTIFYKAVEGETKPQVAHIGKNSMIAKKYNIDNPAKFDDFTDRMDKEFLDCVHDDHIKAESGKPVLTIETMSVDLPDHDKSLEVNFKRLILPVRDRSGTQYILCYAQAL